jgi:hypothetical protein
MSSDENLPEDSPRKAGGTLLDWPQWIFNGQPSPTGRFTFTTLAAVEKRRCPAGLRFDRSGDIANGGASGSKTT